MKLDTVRIVAAEAPGGFVVVNRSDFDEQRHRLWPDTTAESEQEPGGDNKLETDAGQPGGSTQEADRPLEGMSVPELRECAKELGLELPAGTVAKAALVDMIRAARNKAGAKSEGKSEDKGVEKTA